MTSTRLRHLTWCKCWLVRWTQANLYVLSTVQTVLFRFLFISSCVIGKKSFFKVNLSLQVYEVVLIEFISRVATSGRFSIEASRPKCTSFCVHSFFSVLHLSWIKRELTTMKYFLLCFHPRESIQQISLTHQLLLLLLLLFQLINSCNTLNFEVFSEYKRNLYRFIYLYIVVHWLYTMQSFATV